jgi:flavin reductase (DIM6/NTAB) family NADH-FMN oxidoreductase RutF
MAGPVSSATFRESLAQFASGVTVVTARADERRVGFTASAFTSVSLDPPLILVCVGQSASAHPDMLVADFFGVSVLAEDQRWVAEQFARKNCDRFEGIPLRAGPVSGVPFVQGALVHLECRVHTRSTAGDHTIFIGEVVDAVVVPGKPLLHHARRFGAFAGCEPVPA